MGGDDGIASAFSARSKAVITEPSMLAFASFSTPRPFVSFLPE